MQPPAPTTDNDILAEMRKTAEAIFRAGLEAADPATAVQRLCRLDGEHLVVGDARFNLSTIRRIFVIGAGKATAKMALAIEALLGGRIDDGLISVKYGHTAPLARIKTIEAGHPIPDDNGIQASAAMMAMVSDASSDDLVIVLISGGGSALLPLPAEGLSLADKQKTTDLLLGCGATIQEINAVRKHLSAIKGGRLAQAAAPARTMTLILSDVVGDSLDAIASGPTVPDPTTFSDCLRILDHYHIQDQIPTAVRQHLLAGAGGHILESPENGTHDWGHVNNLIVGSNTIALRAASRQAEKAGYGTLILSSCIEGNTRDVAKVHSAIARQILTSGDPVPGPACILSGGETTVVVTGNGKGGRNQEFALSAAINIDGHNHIVILSAGTDGTDGPTDAAGAFADSTTVLRSRTAGLDIRRHLANNDAYPFFKRLGDLLMTGPTGTNVMDLNIVLVNNSAD